jgi:hypothetical protein
MKRAWGVLLLGLGVMAWNTAARGEEGKGTVVELDGLKSRAPANWKAEEPSNRMRAYQFRIPAAKGDKDDGELVIFHFGAGGGGSAEDNVKRWKGMFLPPEGKKIDDVAKVEKTKVGSVPVTYLDVQGTYLHKERPFDPNAKTDQRPDYRMLGIVFESEKGPYFIRFVGPAKTVSENKKGFDDWLKNFK